MKEESNDHEHSSATGQVAIQHMADLVSQHPLDVFYGQLLEQAPAEDNEVPVRAPRRPCVDRIAILYAKTKGRRSMGHIQPIEPLVYLGELQRVERLRLAIDGPRHHPTLVQLNHGDDRRWNEWCHDFGAKPEHSDESGSAEACHSRADHGFSKQPSGNRPVLGVQPSMHP